MGPSEAERATWQQLGQLLFQHAPAGVAVLDLTGRFVEVNPALEVLLQRSAVELRDLTFAGITHVGGADDDWPALRELLDGRRDSVRTSRRLVRPDGSTLDADVVLCAARDEYQIPRRLVAHISGAPADGAVLHVTERPGPDPFSRLASRATTRSLLGHALRLPPSMGVLAVLHVDVAGLLVADGDGGPSRDQILPVVAARLVDAVGVDGIVGRAGPDAFVVVLDEASSPSEVDALAAGLRAALEGVGIALGVARPTVRVGVDLPVRGVGPTPDLGRGADLAIARAQAAGLDPVVRPTPPPPDGPGSADELTTALDEDRPGGGVTAWFQPVVELATGAVVGHEALARWRHPQRGVLRPAQFMPAAELRGITARVDDAVLDHVCRHLASAPADGGFASINLSLGTVLRPGLADRVRERLAVHSVAPERLVVELTEAVVLQLSPAARRDLLVLDAEGVRIFLDDFGTGYGALAVFDDLPVQGVKLDRGLLEGSRDDARRARMLGALREMVDALGIAGVVEGVETTEEAELLISMGWRHAQGYLFGSPQPLSPA